MSNLGLESELNAVCQFSFIQGKRKLFVPPKVQHCQDELDEVCDFSFIMLTNAKLKRKTAKIEALNKRLASRFMKAYQRTTEQSKEQPITEQSKEQPITEQSKEQPITEQSKEQPITEQSKEQQIEALKKRLAAQRTTS